MITLATWNVEWAKPRDRDAIRARIAEWDPDILVVTEGDAGVLPQGGCAHDGGTDWGYVVKHPERRKVILWSRWPSRDVRTIVPPGVRTGRLIDAVVESPGDDIRVIAACIPWSDAHVRTGIARHGHKWLEHGCYVRHLGRLIAQHPASMPLVVMGDFNQRLPRSRQPQAVHDSLATALAPLRVVTAGKNPLPGLSRQEVDHIAVSPEMAVERVWGVDRHDGERKLSDHDAVLAEVARA